MSNAARFLYPFYTVCHLFLLAWAHYLYSQSHQVGLVVLILVVTAIAYDNLIVSVGSLIGKGKTLLKLSQPRFICHVLLTPLSIFAAFSFCLQSHLEWAFQPLSIFIVCFLVVSLFAVEILTYYKKFESKEVWFQVVLEKLIVNFVKKFESKEVWFQVVLEKLIVNFAKDLVVVFPEEWDEWQHWISDMMESLTRMQSKGMNHRLISLITFYRLTRFVWHIGIDKVFILATRRATR